jgi:hypothetical protein
VPLPSLSLDDPVPPAPPQPAAWWEQTPYRFQDAPAVVPPPPPPTGLPPAPPQPPPPRARSAAVPDDEEEGSTPYSLAEGPDHRCPECTWVSPPEAVVCGRCGFDFRTGKMPAKVYEPVERHWEADLTLGRRLVLYAALQVLPVASGLFMAWWTHSLAGFVIPWLVFSGLLAFILGTYCGIDLSRDRRGRVRITRTWRVGFLPRPPVTVRLAEFESVATGRANEADVWDWVILLFLVPFGLIGAFVYWHFFINQDQFFVSLCKDHGYPSFTLYQGWSQSQMEEIADTVREVGEIP